MLSDFEIEALLLSIKVALWAVGVGFPVAVGLALLLRQNYKSRLLIFAQFTLGLLVNVPLVVPPVVVGYALLILFAPTGHFGSWLQELGLNPAFSWKAAAIASMIMALPLMVRSLLQAFEATPKIYTEVAATLGAGPWRRFWTISLPLASGGIRTGLVLGFARAIGEFGATITFAANIPGLTRTLPLALYTASQSPGGDAGALRLAVLCLIPAIASMALSQYFTHRHKKHREDRA